MRIGWTPTPAKQLREVLVAAHAGRPPPGGRNDFNRRAAMGDEVTVDVYLDPCTFVSRWIQGEPRSRRGVVEVLIEKQHPPILQENLLRSRMNR
jgi:hypothetical protein